MNQRTRNDSCPECKPTARLPVTPHRRSRAAAPVFAVASAILVGLAAVATVTVAWGSVPQERRSAPPALDPTTEFIPGGPTPTPTAPAASTSSTAKVQPTRALTHWQPPVTTRPTTARPTSKPPTTPAKTPGEPSSAPSTPVSTSPSTAPSSGSSPTPTGTVATVSPSHS